MHVINFHTFAGYPSLENQQTFLEKFYCEAGLEDEDCCVEYVETHTTGHRMSGKDEVEALAAVTGTRAHHPVLFGSLLSSTGNLLAASCEISVV